MVALDAARIVFIILSGGLVSKFRHYLRLDELFLSAIQDVRTLIRNLDTFYGDRNDNELHRRRSLGDPQYIYNNSTLNRLLVYCQCRRWYRR